MKNAWKYAIVACLAVAVAATFALRAGKRAEYVATPVPAPATAPAPEAAAAPTPQPAAPQSPIATPAPKAVPVAGTPRLLELGSMRCQACLEMAKVLDALRESQGAKLQVVFIDVFEEPQAAERHKVAMIPTQVLFDGAGREVFRHVGYFSHDDILAKFRELGVKL